MLKQSERSTAKCETWSQLGFSLIELLVVVAIVLILASIALPNYLKSRIAANEASAVESIRVIQTALTAYSTGYPAIGYPAQLSDLSNGGTNPCLAAPTQACLLDVILASGTKSGYVITYAPDTTTTPSPGYAINADPIVRGRTGDRSFYTNTPGVIRFNPTAPATPTDPPI